MRLGNTTHRIDDNRRPALVIGALCLGVLCLACLAAAPADAGSIAVVVRGPQGVPLAQAPILLHPPYRPEVEISERLAAPGTYRGLTDRSGNALFLGLPPGRYTVTLPQLGERWLQPSENPLAPAPVMTLFDGEETLRMEVQIQIGVPVGVAIDTPALPRERFQVHFRHRATGFERIAEVRPELPRISHLLSEGLWDVWVTAPAGQLLVALEHDRKSLPGSAATLELELPNPPESLEPTWLTFTYSTPATIEGDVLVDGGSVQEITIEATLMTAGEWQAASAQRGGSIVSPVQVPVAADGSYRLELPDGIWSVVPLSPRIVSSEPPSKVVELGPEQVAEVDFEIELDEQPLRTFRVRVLDPLGRDVEGAVVWLVPLEAPAIVVQQGVTEAQGVDLGVVPEGHYLLLAGHPDFLEGRRELYDFRSEDVRELRIEISHGAELYLRAVDLEGRPTGGVEWLVEHLDPPIELLLRDPTFVEAKTRRRAVTDDSGRVRVPGLYGGHYRLRAERPAFGDPRDRWQTWTPGGLFHVGRTLSHVRPRLELYLSDQDSAQAWARQLPAANLRFQLFCDDGAPPPPTASVIVIDLDGPTDLDAARRAAILVREQVPLGGRGRDVLLVGPLDQGVYRLALQPLGFNRWTWAYETHHGRDSHPIQIDIDEKDPAALLDLGPFRLECSPAVDLAPTLRRADLPDLREVEIRAKVLAAQRDRELGLSPAIASQRERFEIRGLPQGPSRLDVVLSHPHFLPKPDLHWQVRLDLQRGQLVQLKPKVPGLGGAVRIYSRARSAVVARVEGSRGEPVDVPVEGWPILVPSLVPGTYSVTLCSDPLCAETVRSWPVVEILQGVTKELR